MVGVVQFFSVKNIYLGYILINKSSIIFSKKYTRVLFTRREGNPGARVTLATEGYPSTLIFLLFLARRVYKEGRVTLATG